jgi:hypothetical protein
MISVIIFREDFPIRGCKFLFCKIISTLGIFDSNKFSLLLFLGAPSMGAVYRVKVPSTEGDIGVSLRQGCPP